jgi:hypothetical protein
MRSSAEGSYTCDCLPVLKLQVSHDTGCDHDGRWRQGYRSRTGLRRAIPHGTLQILHGIGHMIHHVATQEVVDAIEEVARKSADVLPRPEYSGSGHILRFALNAEEGGKASA